MILNRLGKKSKIADKVQAYFPPHKTYIEPFFGAGGMYFNKPKAQYNILNDLDSDVSNLFWCVINRKDELAEAFDLVPFHVDLLDHWKQNQETDPIKKALRFLFLSNFTYMGKMGTLKFSSRLNPKDVFFNNLDFCKRHLEGALFNNSDSVRFLKSISFKEQKDIEKSFVYCDPPYLGTENNYSSGFSEKDCVELLDCLQSVKGLKFAYSEFDNPFILAQAEQRGLFVNNIGERLNIKNRRTEILITNYKQSQLVMF